MKEIMFNIFFHALGQKKKKKIVFTVPCNYNFK